MVGRQRTLSTWGVSWSQFGHSEIDSADQFQARLPHEPRAKEACLETPSDAWFPRAAICRLHRRCRQDYYWARRNNLPMTAVRQLRAAAGIADSSESLVQKLDATTLAFRSHVLLVEMSGNLRCLTLHVLQRSTTGTASELGSLGQLPHSRSMCRSGPVDAAKLSNQCTFGIFVPGFGRAKTAKPSLRQSTTKPQVLVYLAQKSLYRQFPAHRLPPAILPRSTLAKHTLVRCGFRKCHSPKEAQKSAEMEQSTRWSARRRGLS